MPEKHNENCLTFPFEMKLNIFDSKTGIRTVKLRPTEETVDLTLGNEVTFVVAGIVRETEERYSGT